MREGFDERIKEADARFKKAEREIERAQLFAKIWAAFCFLVAIGAIGFMVWVVVKVMGFYGIL